MPASLHWYRTESHASPLGYELRAEYRGRTWRMYRLADGTWKIVPTDRPQQTKTFRTPEEARKWASQAAMTNPGRKRNPQGVNMAKKTKNPTSKRKWIRVPGGWLRPGMIVKAPEYVRDFHLDDEPKIKWQDWPQHDPEYAFPDPMPTRLRVDYWGEGTDAPDGESDLVAIDARGRETGVSFDWNTGAFPEIWLVEADSIDDLDDAARAQGQYPPSAENPIRGARKAVSTEVDEHAAQELRLFIDNDGTLYRQRRQPIEKNLLKKWKKGTFDAARATDAYMYLVDDGAKKYAKDFGGVWNEIFPKATRRYVADEYATDFAHDLKEDPTTYDHLLEKNPAPRRRKNPSRRKKNGAGLGALIGSTIGAVAGFGAGSVPLAALGSLAGGTVGGYLGAPKDRKKRGAAGGAIGGALLGPVGAGIGGYVGGTKADKDYGGRRNNPGRKALREQNPSDDKITGPNEDGVYSFRGYSIELFGPSSGWYGFMLIDPQRNEEEHAYQAKTRMEAFKIAIDEIKTRTRQANNPGPACGCPHRTASMSRRISNP